MRFRTGHRILDLIKPRNRVIGMRSYLKARWKMFLHMGQYRFPAQIHKKKKPWQRGWMPGKLRLDGMQAPRRVINPAVRFQPITRACNEIIARRRKQRAYPPFVWARKKPR